MNRRRRLLRCEECKRRKKLCKGNDESCDYCTKKGVRCISNSFRMVNFSQVSLQHAADNSNGNHPFIPPITRAKQRKQSLTKSKLLIFLKGLVSQPYLNTNSSSAHLDLMMNSSFYLPLIESRVLANTTDIHVIVDQNVTKLVNDNLLLTTTSSLSNFLISCTRVNSINLSGNTPLTLESIEHFSRVTRDPNTLELVKDNFEISNTTNIIAATMEGNKKLPSFPNTFTSLDDVKFIVDIDNINNSFSVEECGVNFGAQVSFNFCVEIGLGQKFVTYLFEQFCDTKGHINHFLNVCLPVVIGSTITIEAAIVLSFYKLKSKRSFSEHEHGLIDTLYLHCLQELQNRMSDYHSIACDHTMLTILMLLDVELLRGARGILWGQLITLSRYTTMFRGGVQKLASNLTGLCMMKLFASQLCLAFYPLVAEVDNSVHQLTLADFFYIIDTKPELNFFDDVNYFAGSTLAEMRDLVKTVGHISYLYSLANVCYAGNLPAPVDGGVSRFESYQYINEHNLRYVLSEAVSIELNVRELLTKSMENQDENIPSHYRMQRKFSLLASLLYISQTIYKQTSKSPKTMLLVKELCLELNDLFTELIEGVDYGTNTIVIFVLPFVLLGVDLMGEKDRENFKSKLMELYQKTFKEGILTAIKLLQKVWERNKDGDTFVDWREISKEEHLRVCLHC